MNVPIEKAFRVFTVRMAAWWPATHHIAKEPFVEMQRHLAYIRSQVEAGKFVLVGPLTEDNHIRGIAVNGSRRATPR